ncbi:hypothetical protein ABZ468_51120 [Streptomyces sp. NPDC005708]|uniref:hypothetical protein n=1 Tax=Streptomyces sp. NPDC005708 TaxID=3154564 RepID=UPI0033C74523
MALLAEHHVTGTPGRRVVEVYDADAYLGDEAALDAAEQLVVAGNGYHLYLLSLQPDIPVQVTLRTWDTPPAPPADTEGHTRVSIESETGTLSSANSTAHPPPRSPCPAPASTKVTPGGPTAKQPPTTHSAGHPRHHHVRRP